MYLANWKHSEGVLGWSWAHRIVECMFGGWVGRGLYAKESRIQKIIGTWGPFYQILPAKTLSSLKIISDNGPLRHIMDDASKV